MQAGKIASLILVVIVTAVFAAAWLAVPFVPSLQEKSDAAQLAVLCGFVALTALALFLPLGETFDRTLRRLEREFDAAVRNASGPAIGNPPRWLRPVTRAFTRALHEIRGREHSLKNQLGELEIRYRVSEAGRRQTEAVLHAIRDAVIVSDCFDEVVMANEAAADALGFDLDSVSGKPLDSVIRDERLRQLIRDTKDAANFAEVRHVELSVSGSEFGDPSSQHNTRNSELRTFDVTLACVENHKREVGGVVAILHDLTREREVSEMKSDFVAKASHELRTPLSSIRAYVEMLVDGEATDERSRQEFYRIIQQETERVDRLVDNMLNISRIEAGIVQIDRQDVDIKALFHRAIHTLEPQAQEKNISLTAKLPAVDLTVEGDADMLYQVALNLVSNAVKYTPEGGRVTVAADSDNLTRSVLVSVSDTGLGIPPDAMDKLFEKFFRVEIYKRVAKGTGLGLSLCKHIVETVHHGQIGVDSKLGMGSKFWFTIPMRYAGSREGGSRAAA